ncbi:MAG: hypothetical protein IKQ70_04370 [Bacteroidales bacterium]|nr:hypothetical protein [Bacteroidales bacterium]
MKKWIIIIGSIIVVLIVIGVLHDRGYLNFKWTTLTNIFAALAGPYMLMKNKFFNRNSVSSVQEILDRAKQGLLEDEEHRKEYDTKIEEKENQIKLLEQRIESLDSKIQTIEQQKANVHQEVQAMTPEQMMIEFEKYYGNEKDD